MRSILLLLIFAGADNETSTDRDRGKLDIEALAVVVRPSATDLGPVGPIAIAFDYENAVAGGVLRGCCFLFLCHLGLLPTAPCGRSGSRIRKVSGMPSWVPEARLRPPISGQPDRRRGRQQNDAGAAGEAMAREAARRASAPYGRFQA